MAEPIQTVVVGYGMVARVMHIPLISMTPGLELRGVCSTDPQKRSFIQQHYGVMTYSSYQQVLDDPEVQLVALCTPNPAHAPQAIAAVNAGKHVVTDKPMCLNAQEAWAMIEAADKNRRVLSVFHNRRWDGDFLTLQKLMDEGDLGDVRWLEMAWQRYGAPANWRSEPAMGGGRLIDLGAHLIDQVLCLFPGKVTRIFCRKHYDFPHSKVESHGMLMLCFDDGRTAVVDTTSAAFSPKPRIFALGSKATFIKYGLDPQEEALASGDIHLAHEDPADYGQLTDRFGSRVIPTEQGHWLSFYANIAHVLHQPDPYGSRQQLAVRAEQSARVIEVLDHAAQSAANNEPVVVGV